MSERLERSTTNQIIAGVCGGLAEHLHLDATLVRVLFVSGTVLTAGAGVIVYIVLLILMPLPGRPAPLVGTPLFPASAEPRASDDPTQPPPPPGQAHEISERRTSTIGYLLILLGAIFLVGNFGAFRFVRFDVVWPLVLIVLGVFLLSQRVRS